MAARPEVLIERWFPIDVIGAESMRERGASSALPPLYFLHVWWARRPLTTSRAAILASVLPVWSPDWPSNLRERFPTEESYRAWFLKLCGVFGDPVAGRRLLQAARSEGKSIPNPYKASRAFTVSPSAEFRESLSVLLHFAWGSRTLSILDPFAGGGSIPFEALRYGFTTCANELNAVAAVILRATLEYPARFGPKLADDIHEYGKILAENVQRRLRPFYSDLDDEHRGAEGLAYLWARTVRCPYTGKPIPLSPNWWLQKGTSPIAVRPLFEPNADEAQFEIVKGKTACARAKPDQGTVRKGDAISPWAQNQPVDGDYIKSEAQAGRLGEQLYGVAVKRAGGFDFRSPTPQDNAAVARAAAELDRQMASWERRGWIPREPRKEGRADWATAIYGIATWADTFAPRQLLAMLTLTEAFHRLKTEVEASLPAERAKAVMTFLAFAIDKAADYNSRQASWHAARSVIRNTFTRHDLSFRWAPAEFDASRNLVPWVVEQVVDAYRGLAQLSAGNDSIFDSGSEHVPVQISKGSAADLATIAASTIDAICVDPPYYDNVMYAELADYFYVWLKRTVGQDYSPWFDEELTNKDDEAVSNEARFRHTGARRKQLALADYERKMAAAFREMHRVLRDDGVLTVMFTHKKIEAWDTLATSLIGAGFAIHSSWPVHTESEHSLHQAKKNAAQSTILLTCRKRTPRGEPVWWDDIKGKVRQAAREKAAEFERQGIRGVDLYIATFGPTLAILSESWPVLTSEVDERTGEPKPLRPEMALDLAREEVISLRKQGLLLGRPVQFDPHTDWYLMAWDAFKAEEFPGDEARKLALALGLDLEREVIGEKRLVTKKGARVAIQQPKARRKRDMVDPDRRAFECWIDAAHTAMLLYEEDGARACQAFLTRTGLGSDATFKACIQALLNAIPRTKEKGKFVRPEAEVLEAMRLAFFDDLVAPVEEELRIEPHQLRIAETAATYGEAGDADEEADEEDNDEE
jgi:putative DNA methylase